MSLGPRAHLKSLRFQLARLRSDFADYARPPLHAFTSFMIEGTRQKWKKAGMQPRSINRDIQRLQSVLSRAVEWGVLDRHPFTGLKPMKADKTGRVRFLTSDEETALREAFETREDKLEQARIRFNTLAHCSRQETTAGSRGRRSRSSAPAGPDCAQYGTAPWRAARADVERCEFRRENPNRHRRNGEIWAYPARSAERRGIRGVSSLA